MPLIAKEKKIKPKQIKFSYSRQTAQFTEEFCGGKKNQNTKKSWSI